MPKRERSQEVRLWEMFTVKYKNLFCKNKNKKNLLIKKYVQYRHFQINEICKRCNIFLINNVLKVVP